MEPGGNWRDDSPEQIEAMRLQALRSYLAWGVTTVLDTGSLRADANAFDVYEEDHPHPEIAFLGPILSPEGGYPAVVLPDFPMVGTADDVREQFEEWDGLYRTGVKITFEEGMATRVWPLYSDEVKAAIREEAEQRDLPLFAHAMSVKEHHMALDLSLIHI